MTTDQLLPSVEVLDESHLKMFQRTWCSEVILSRVPPPHWNSTYHKCKRTAQFRVNGCALCEIHAGRRVLQSLIEISTVTNETSNAKEARDESR